MDTHDPDHTPSTLPDRMTQFLSDCRYHVETATPIEASGRLTRVAGLVMEAAGLQLPLGSTCSIVQNGQQALSEAEVVGFHGERLFLMPTTELQGLSPGARVMAQENHPAPPSFGKPSHPWRRAEDRTKHLPVGSELLGRVLDAAGRPLDRLGPVAAQRRAPLMSRPLNPIEREPISQTMDVGVRAINGMLTIGRGQRIGLFAGTGVGKSVLLGMMAKYAQADVTVVGLIGERGREVKEFIEDILGDEGMARAVVVAAPADSPPLMRLQGASYATLIAEHFRNEGKNVLLIMDSLTRYAMAQREIALAIGEPPATKGYPPSVFAKLPNLVERAGNGPKGGGSITAFYTVLTEGDDPQDPIADAARGILDGHIVLTRDLAESGHYPAIDVEQSISRVMHAIVDEAHIDAARRLKALFSRYRRNADLINVGAYVAGSDPLLDQAIRMKPAIDHYLKQSMSTSASFNDSLHAILQIAAAC